MDADFLEGLSEAKEQVTKLTVPPPPPPPISQGGPLPPPPPILVPKNTITPPTTSGGLDAELLRRALKKQQASVVRDRTLADELTELNQALASSGKRYRVPSEAGLQEAKRAAGLGNTKQVAINFGLLRDQLLHALSLGAFGDIDEDASAKRLYAAQVKEALLARDPSIGKRQLSGGGRLADHTVTFEECSAWAERVTERQTYEITADALAVLIVSRLGSGALGGLFPGEAPQLSVEQLTQLPEKAMRERIMADRELIMGEFGRAVAQMLASAFPEDSPELTGSILAPSVELNRPPEDVDVNVSTHGTPEARTEEFLSSVDYVDGEVFIVQLTDIAQKIAVFPKMATKVSGRIAELFYAYSLNYIHHNKKLNFSSSESVLGSLVPVDLEIKDVGGAEWVEHLKDTAEERTTNPDQTSKGRWLLADILNRIHSFRALMRERLKSPDTENDEIAPLKGEARQARWRELVLLAGMEESERKKLFEKLHTFGNMAMLEFSGEAELQVAAWLDNTIAGSLIDDFKELFVIGCSNDRSLFEAWLSDID